MEECDDYLLQQKLSDIINNAIEAAFMLENGYNTPPLVACEGLAIEHSGNSWETPGIGLDPKFVESIANMAETINTLRDTVTHLENMHLENSVVDHTPEIISTREQYEEMKPKMDKEDRILVHTTFDKALKVL